LSKQRNQVGFKFQQSKHYLLTNIKTFIMLKEFKSFIMTGNVVEFAVAVIMAAAIGAVVNGFVSDIVMPVIGQLSGGVSFNDMHYALNGETYSTLAAAEEAGAPVIAYGRWIDKIVNLLVVGFVMFLIIKSYNKMKKKEEAAPAAPAGPSVEDLLTEIRDALKK
jgi:large conductance mechanosensitive channel